MRSRLYITAGMLSIIGLVAMQWAILFNAPKKMSYDMRAIAADNEMPDITITSPQTNSFVGSEFGINFKTTNWNSTEAARNRIK